MPASGIGSPARHADRNRLALVFAVAHSPGMTWNIFIKAIGGYGSLVAALAFLWASLIHFRYSVQLAKITGALQILGKKQEIAYTRLHGKRAELIETLYRKLLSARDIFTLAHQGLMIHDFVNPEKEDRALETFVKAMDTLADLRIFCRSNDIFFEKELMQQLDGITEGFRAVQSVGLERGKPEKMGLRHIQQITALEQAIDILLDCVKDEFRAMLGVEVKKQGWFARLRASYRHRRILKQLRG